MNERMWERVSLAFRSCAPIEERLVFLGGVELFIQVCRAPAVWKPAAMLIQLKELEQRDRELWEFFVYLCRRPAPWRIAAYLRWRMEGKRTWEI